MYNVDIGVPSQPFRVTATNAATGTSAASISGGYGAITNRKLAITHFSGSSSISGSYTIESPAGTVIWQKVMGGTNHAFSDNFDPPLVVAAEQAVVFKASGFAAINTGTVNGAGFEVYAVV